MKQYAEHDKIGVSHPLRGDDIYTNVFSGGYPYLKNGLLLHSTPSNPIYSYGKNYEKKDGKFSLFVWTTESDQSKIENLFKKSVKSVTAEQIAQVSERGSFVYLD